MKRPSGDASEPDVEAQLREAFTAVDPESAWYFDRGMERVVRVSHGATSIPDLPAQDVEEDEARYVEIPALTDGELHDWIERFVEEKDDEKVAAMLDERVGANARFLKRVAAEPALAAEWKAFHGARVAEALQAWRDGLA
jgi:hypothetical protein